MSKLTILCVSCLLLTLTLTLVNANRSKVLMCYVLSWSVYRPDQGKFTFNNIDGDLCTHLIYAYHKINETTWQIETGDKWADSSIGGLRKLAGLKKDNPDLKILVSIGGWGGGAHVFSQLSADQNKRNTFVQSVMSYLKRNRLDGIDIDWQFPVVDGGKPEDKENFVALLQELRKEFDTKGYILTVRLKGSRYYAEGYDLPAISDAVDYINLKSYAFHGTWDKVTDVNSPLKDKGENNVAFSVDYLLDEGVESAKLLLGLCTEGNAELFVIDEGINDDNYLGQKITGGYKGPWVNEEGMLGYNELCWLFKREGADWKHRWDAESSTPYSVKDNKFTSYDNQQSFHHKLELVEERELGGVSLFSIDKDDFNGLCHDQKYILTNTVKNYLNSFKLNVQVQNQEYRRKRHNRRH